MSPIWIPSPPPPREINKHAHPVYTLRLQNDIEQFLLLSRPVVWTNAQSRVDFTSFTIRNSVEHLAPPILPRCVLYLRANKPYIRPITLVTARFLLAGTNVCPSVKLLSLSLGPISPPQNLKDNLWKRIPLPNGMAWQQRHFCQQNRVVRCGCEAGGR